MPALPFVTNMIKVALGYAAPGVAGMLNNLFFKGTQQGTTGGLTTACQTMANSWATNMAPVTQPSVTLNVVLAEDKSSASAPTGQWLGTKAGTNANTEGAPAVSLVMRNGISSRYRGGHSRIYIPGIPVYWLTSDDANTWSSANAALVSTGWSTFLGNCLSALQTAGYGTVTAWCPHYYSGGTNTWVNVGTDTNPKWKLHRSPNPNPPGEPYTTVAANLIVGSQRRRNHQSV